MIRKTLLGFAAVLFASSFTFTACLMDFDQFQAGGSGGAGGNCGGCCVPLDCPEPAEPCMQATCEMSTCGEAPRPDGTTAGSQTDGDCKKLVCQGGVATPIDDPDDPIDDGNDCTVDSCLDGMPISDPASMGAMCRSNGGAVCDGAGECVECLSDMDCPAEEPKCDTAAMNCVPASCTDEQKNGSETDTDCGGGVCSPCATGDDCLSGADCQSGICDNGKCEAPACDDGIENGSETDTDCGGGCPQGCGPNQGCDDDGDCAGGDCTGAGGTCVPNCNDGVTNNAESDTDCGGGTCDACGLGASCGGVDANCLSGNCGPGDVCTKSPDGAPCGSNDECDSTFCQQGVCCATACGDACEACNLMGSAGTCTPVPMGMDPNDDCADPATCDGAGFCKSPQGSPCMGVADCAMGLFCVDGICCDAVCGATCKACNVPGSEGACVNVPSGQDPDDECNGVCNGNGACVPGPNGSTCAAPGDCTSNQCADGVCCATACGDTCKACDVAGSEGTCTNVPGGTDPDNDCSGMQTCNGMGACN